MAKSCRILSLLLACISCYHSALSEKQLSPFEKVTLEPAFIDKTDLIKTFISTAHQTNCYNVLITCPSRFGKSSNLDMIKRFLEYSDDENVKTQNQKLFKNPKLELHIAKEADFFSQHFAKYSILFLNFSVEGHKATHEEVFGVVKDQIKQLFAQYSWLYNPPSDKTNRTYPNGPHKEFFEKIQSDKLDNLDYEESLRILADDLSNYLDGDREIVLLIDDYDAPIRFAMENQAKGSTIIPLIQALLTDIFVDFAMVVGTLVFDSFNKTIRNFNFLEEHQFLDYFGFTLKDIRVLSKIVRCNLDVKKNYKIQQYYNGYQTKTGKSRLFNPASVAAYCRERKFENFLPKTGYTINLVEPLLRSEYLRDEIQNLIVNRASVFKHKVALKLSHIDVLEEILAKDYTPSPFASNEVALYLSVLFQQGYLSYMDDASPQEFPRFRLPNEEVRLQLAEDVYKYFQKVVHGYQEKAKNVFTSFKNIMNGSFTEEELKKETITALLDIVDPLYALGERDDEQLTLDFLTFIYTSLVFGAEPEEKFDSIELAVVVDTVISGELGEESGKISLTVWNKDKTVLLYVEMKTYPEFETLQDALTRSESFRPSGQLTKKPYYLKLLMIYLNVSKKVEIGFGPTVKYRPSDGKWISTQRPLRCIPSENMDWQELRRRNCLYADKTVYLERMLNHKHFSKLFYLNRPRRFGKSSFLDMAHSFFEGNKTRFEGLYIGDRGNLHFFEDEEGYGLPQHLRENKWAQCPVIHLDFSELHHSNTTTSLMECYTDLLKTIGESYGLEVKDQPHFDISKLISWLKRKFQFNVVVLIDEYDSPFQEALQHPNKEMYAFAEEIRFFLNQQFRILKARGKDLRLVLVMGILRLDLTVSQSGPNSFVDLTYEEDFAGAFGFTIEEIKDFYPEIDHRFNLNNNTEKFDKFIRDLTENYDGYNFTYQKTESVLNPVSIMKFLEEKEFGWYWSNTGCADEVTRRLYFSRKPLKDLKHSTVLQKDIERRRNYRIGSVVIQILMLQYGYLTIESYDKEKEKVVLNFPNKEILTALQQTIKDYDPKKDGFLSNKHAWYYELKWHMETANAVGSMNTLQNLFSTNFSETLQTMMSEFSLTVRLVDMVRRAGIDCRKFVKFQKQKNEASNESETAGDVDVFTGNLKKNFIMSIKWRGSSIKAIQQVITYLKKYPATFQEVINNPQEAWYLKKYPATFQEVINDPQEAWFVGINFDETGLLDEWVAIPFKNGTLHYDQCEESSNELCENLRKNNLPK